MTTSPADLKNSGHRVVIEPTTGWGRLDLAELWRYRQLTWFLAWRSIKARYRQMALGPLWIIIQPMVNMVIFTLVLGGLAKLPSEGIPYPLFTYTALLPWTYFSGAAINSSGSMVSQMQVISKVYFPRLVVPVSAVLSGLMDMAISFIVLAAMMLYYGFVPGLEAFVLPLFVLLATATALTIGLWTATLSVKFRDVQLVMTRGMQAFLYATPVAYSAELVPEQWQWLYRLNPMYWVIEGFRWSLLGVGTPPGPGMLIPTMATLVALLVGAYVFRRTERTIVDLL